MRLNPESGKYQYLYNELKRGRNYKDHQILVIIYRGMRGELLFWLYNRTSVVKKTETDRTHYWYR